MIPAATRRQGRFCKALCTSFSVNAVIAGIMAFCISSSMAQAPEVPNIWPAEGARMVVVEPDNFPATIGALNQAIEADLNPDGTHSQPNTIYVLRNGGSYFLEANLEYQFPLFIQAEVYPSTNPPIVRPGTDLLGDSPNVVWMHDDFEFRGVYFYAVDDAGALRGNIRSFKEDGIHIVRDCWLEAGQNYMYQFYAINQSWYIIDTFMRNAGRPTSHSNMRMWDTRGHDTKLLFIQNSSIYNVFANFLRTGGSRLDEVYIDHFTGVNHVGSANWSIEDVQKFTLQNSLFRNVMIDGDFEYADQAAAGERVFNTDGFLPAESYEGREDGLTDADRQYVIRNNNFSLTPDQIYLDVWASHYSDSYVTSQEWEWENPNVTDEDPEWANRDTVRAVRVAALPLDSTLTAWVEQGEPWVTYQNNIDEQVSFTDPPDDILDWYNAWLNAELEPHHYDRWEETSADPFSNYYAPNPGGGETTSLWRDLSYNTDSQSYTAGTGGFPLGNLNYFPERKQAWIATSVEEPTEGLPDRFRLIGNYPNPFNPSTNIVFDLAAPSDVEFEVYNLLGRKVGAVQLGAYGAGRHTATLDASDLPSGIYMVRMQIDGAVESLRVMLVK